MPYCDGHNKYEHEIKKNGDAPGPLGDFVKWLVTERTQKKRQTKKKEIEKT